MSVCVPQVWSSHAQQPHRPCHQLNLTVHTFCAPIANVHSRPFDGDMPSLHVLLLDSVSWTNIMNLLPRTIALLEDIAATSDHPWQPFSFLKYHSVGINTFSNFRSFLTGKSCYEKAFFFFQTCDILKQAKQLKTVVACFTTYFEVYVKFNNNVQTVGSYILYLNGPFRSCGVLMRCQHGPRISLIAWQAATTMHSSSVAVLAQHMTASTGKAGAMQQILCGTTFGHWAM